MFFDARKNHQRLIRRAVSAALASVLIPLAANPAQAASYIRVNLIGYQSTLSAEAYLMTTSSISGETFAIKNASGSTVATGNVSATSGKWGSYNVYPISFTLSTPGSYHISVSGTVSANSPPFSVNTTSNLYSQGVANALSFYQNERDGANYISSALRTAPGHLNDANATVYKTPAFDSNDNITSSLSATGATIDASGGWWDAGDYLKFVQTHSYVVALMLVGIRDFPAQMGASSNSDFTNEAKFGLDWLQKMWDDNSETLYYQVGIGTDFTNANYQSDHDIWRLPQADDTYGGSDSTYQYIRHRPVFVAGSAGSKISPNLAGRLAADFALCYYVFKNTDTSYANQCLRSAEHIFDLANTSPGTLLTVAPNDFYPETEWRDDMELGATELYFALQSGGLPSGLPHTDPSYYLQQAATWAHNYITGPNDGSDTLNLYDVSGLAHFDLYRAITLAGNPSGLAVTQSDLLSDIANQIQTSVSQSKDPFGTPWAWGSSDTVSHEAGLSIMAREYYSLTKTGSYATDARRWMANVLGANPWGLSFIVGDGSLFPYCMQHQVANIVGSTNGMSPILSGAVVEGPTNAASSGSLDGMVTCPPNGEDSYKAFNGSGAVYKDNVQSYSTDEPAIDLTATSFLMFSWQIAGAPATTP
ncbi:glycoside hydrolase family 9 protein [Dyella nitratireducens]|uniref:Hydrolase n=1 Tax=Dyella nitratireducens TaxID=1849580 RepID=A0ABQ1FLD4_9GAMM|nr:glycoside hydrolase family 9 protein [Dyella nitratireducens]GGA18659.1 hydrolase [Dyella nitratireducens]GLQ44625.1 hydrolase [Dyella nitratireducens]